MEELVYTAVLDFIALALTTQAGYLNVNKVTRIDDRLSMDEALKAAFGRMKWGIEAESEDGIVFASSFAWWLWKDRIRVRYTSSELFVSGPRKHVDTLVSLIKFPYDVIQITAPVQY